jgi:hypothetical protein
VILHYNLLEVHSLPWIILMPLGGIITFVASKREKQPSVKTYLSESMGIVVKAFSISLFIICFAMPLGQHGKPFIQPS